MTVIQAQNYIAGLEQSLASGKKQISIDGQTIIYDSTADILAALAYFKRQLAILQGNGGAFAGINIGNISQPGARGNGRRFGGFGGGAC